MATFIVLQGPDKGRTIETDDEVVLIGRASSQIPLTDHTVSRRHAQIKREDNGLVLYDLNSINGTYLNGIRVQRPTRLKHGDQIRIGSTLLVYAGHESLEQFSGSAIPQDLVSLDVGDEDLDASIVSTVPSNEDSIVMAAPETASAVKAWKIIRELSDVIGSLLPPDQLLARMMDILFAEVAIDRGVLFMRDKETNEFIPEVVRLHRMQGNPDEQAGIIASRTIIKHVVETCEGVLCSNAVSDKRFHGGKSIANLGMRSVICAPIIAREKVLGVIHLDCPVTRHMYSEHELRLITAVGYQTGLAIENARLVQHQMRQERLAAAGETVAYLSHSIKNILQGMRSGGDLLQRGMARKDEPLMGQGWGILDRSLDKCYKLMMNMLAFSKEREPRLEMLQLNKLVEEAVADIQNQADRKSVVLLADLDENLPPIPLDYDGAQQLILNLITNAIDAVPKGTGVINVRTIFNPADGEVVLMVADNGPGVPPEHRAKIFEPFHSTKGHGGTGLGLAVAHKFVEEMGGKIELYSPEEGGAEFIVQLRTQEPSMPDSGDTHGPGSETTEEA